MFHILLFIHFIEKGTEGKTLFQNHFLQSIKFGECCTLQALPRHLCTMHLCMGKRFSPEVFQAYLNLTPFCGPINIPATYTEHPSLKILRYSLCGLKRLSITEAPSGSVM